MVKVLNREGIQRMVGKRVAEASGSGGEGGGGISLAQVDAAYVSKAFFDQLFTVHGKRTYTDPETQEEVTEDVVISPNQIAEGEYSLSNVEVSVGLWTNSFLSALGLGTGGGGGGATALTDLVDVALSNPQNGQVLMYNSSTGKWYNGTVQSGGGGTVTSITAGTGLTGGTITSSGTIALSENTLTAIDKGVTAYGWGDHSQQGYLTSSALTGYATQQWVSQNYLGANDTAAAATKLATARELWGQSFDGTAAVTGTLSYVGDINSNALGSINNFNKIELNAAANVGNGGAIYFHYNGISGRASGYIINDADGLVSVLTPTGNIGLKVGTQTGDYLQIGAVRLMYDASNNALKVINANGTAANLYATGGVAALGLGTGGGGGGATALTDLVDVALSNPQNGQVLMYNSSTGKWYNGTVQSGGGGTVTSITAGTGLSGGTITSSGTIALSEATLTAIDHGATAYGWGDHAQAGYLTASALTGYATQQWVGQQGFLTASDLNGYATQHWVGQQGFLTASDLNGYATQQWVSQNYLGANDTAAAATKLATARELWGQSFDGTAAVTGTLSYVGDINSNALGSINNFNKIELNAAANVGNGGAIYFHYNGISGRASGYIINDADGLVSVLTPTGNIGLKVGTQTGDYLQIGAVRLMYDASNNALKVINANGTAANLYATGGVAALGMSAGVSQMDAMTFNHLSVKNSMTLNGSVSVITGSSSQILRSSNDSDCIYLLNFGTTSKVTSQNYYFNQYNNVGLHGTDHNYGETWFIDPDGCAKFNRLYLDSTRYLYINGGTLYYYNGSTSRQIAFA